MIGITEAPDSDWSRHAHNIYSQFGEDGLLEEIFRRIGTTNKECFEVGAADGKWFSNTRRLIDKGWRACLIEAGKDNWPELDKLRGKNGTVIVHGLAEPSGTNSLDSILALSQFNTAPDLGVIDVDGQDYYLWNGMLKYRPRVLVIEFNPYVEPGFIPDLGGEGQAGLAALLSIAVSKGYFNVGTTNTNAIFVVQSEREKFYDFPCEWADTNGNGRVWKPEPEKKIEAETMQEIKVAAMMSRPRFGLNCFWDCASEALAPWGIPLRSFYGVFWGQFMQRGMEEALDEGIDWILCLDYDTMFTSKHLQKLIDSLGRDQSIDAIAALQVRRGRPFPLAVSQDGKVPITGGPVKVRTAHFGLTILRAEKLRKLKRPWFWSTPTPAGDWGEGRLDDDIYFWANWGDNGNSLYVHTGCEVGHVEEMVAHYDNGEVKHSYISDWRRANGHQIKTVE